MGRGGDLQLEMELMREQLEQDHLENVAGDLYIEWRPIVGFPGYYINNIGDVFTIPRGGRWKDGRIMSPWHTKHGHLYVDLVREDGVRCRRYIHRLVAEAFIPNPNNYPLVRHLNDIPDDNVSWNLRWGTQTDNMRDCINNGNFRYFTKEQIKKANLVRATPVVVVDLTSGESYNFESQGAAARYLGTTQSNLTYYIKTGRPFRNFKIVKDGENID